MTDTFAAVITFIDANMETTHDFNVEQLLLENTRRKASSEPVYDQLTGEGCAGEREAVTVDGTVCYLPSAMVREEREALRAGGETLRRARIKYDFEYWCATAVTIVDKLTARYIRFVLNRPQRRLLREMETRRLRGEPVRIVLLKARQWGGSTLVQIYMAWLQMVVHSNWNSVIIGHLRQNSAVIKSMFTRLLKRYPKELLPEGDDGKPVKAAFEVFEGQPNVRQLTPGGSLVIIGTAQSEDALRGYDVKLAHLSEVAFWPESERHRPDDVIRSVQGTVPRSPDTVIVMESTADGVGSFFHREWQAAKDGDAGGRLAVFVPWHEIELYTEPVGDAAQLWLHLDDYERDLWEKGLTLEQINWYHNKRLEYGDHAMMKVEFPGDDIEAFTATACCAFATQYLERLRAGCREPSWRGDITGDGPRSATGHLDEMTDGPLEIWQMPAGRDPKRHRRYYVAVDIGGRSAGSDYSVIAVIDRQGDNGLPEVVAQWRGHLDHDLLAWKAVQLANYYNRALLIIESNTLESKQKADVNGDTLLEEIRRAYRNMLYCRGNGRVGFHTNALTKPAIITNLNRYIREGLYTERDVKAVDEMATYERRLTGGQERYQAKQGCHDDIVMTRAIALAVIDAEKNHEPPSPDDFTK